ncbi:hypothetical protein ACIP68_23180 [Streptomyces griseoviridis]
MSEDTTDDNTSPTDLVFDPQTWYSATVRDNNEECRNYLKTFTIGQLYSNDGHYVLVQCGVCGDPMEILTAVRLDPQPEIP